MLPNPGHPGSFSFRVLYSWLPWTHTVVSITQKPRKILEEDDDHHDERHDFWEAGLLRVAVVVAAEEKMRMSGCVATPDQQQRDLNKTSKCKKKAAQPVGSSLSLEGTHASTNSLHQAALSRHVAVGILQQLRLNGASV